MRGSRFTEEQIIGILQEADGGSPTTEVCRRHGTSTATFYNWKARFGGMGVSDARRLRRLEEENRKLEQLLEEATLDNHALRELLRKMHRACRLIGMHRSVVRYRAVRSTSAQLRERLSVSWRLKSGASATGGYGHCSVDKGDSSRYNVGAQDRTGQRIFC